MGNAESKLPANAQRLDRGKLAVLGMFALALAAAGFAVWWNFERTRRCLEFYGSEGASLVSSAPQVTLLELSSDAAGPGTAGASEPACSIAGQRYVVVREVDISKATGLIHARTSLVNDPSFEWNRLPTECESQIRYAVRFTRAAESITIAFDFPCRQLYAIERQRQAMLIPKVAAGWQMFLERQTETPRQP